MISIGVITRGKYGKRLIENFRKNSDFKISYTEIPLSLPEFIDNPADFLEALGLEKKVFSNQLVITYTLHPDLAPEIVRLAGENGSTAVILAGGAGNMAGIRKIAEKYDLYVEAHEICCDMEKCGNPVVDEFTLRFGKPRLKISTRNGIITNVQVIRGAPCGSTLHAASGLIGTGIKDAPRMAGLLVQQYPCRALRGIKGGIHKAAQLHKEAVESAIGEIEDE